MGLLQLYFRFEDMFTTQPAESMQMDVGTAQIKEAENTIPLAPVQTEELVEDEIMDDTEATEEPEPEVEEKIVEETIVETETILEEAQDDESANQSIEIPEESSIMTEIEPSEPQES